MDSFNLKVGDTYILLYRSIYTPIKSNMYIIINNNSSVIIDPHESEDVIKLLKKNKVNKIHILLTHEHFDHTIGVNFFRYRFQNVDVFCQVETAKSIEKERNNNPALIVFVLAKEDKKDGGTRCHDFKKTYKPYTCHAESFFTNSIDREIAGLNFHFKSTPGHSPGSCCIELSGNIFSGDSLLKDDPTILRFPESSKVSYEKITLPFFFSLPENTYILPGHGDPFLLKDSKYLYEVKCNNK